MPVADTAYGNRDAAYDSFPIAIWDTGGRRGQHPLGTRILDRDAALLDGRVYANNLGDEGEDRVRAAYGDIYRRLVALKRKYDPTNFFRQNQNIAPTP